MVRVDESALALGDPGAEGLGDDLLQRAGGALDGAGKRVAAQGAEAHHAGLRLFPGLHGQSLVIHHDPGARPEDHGPVLGEVEGHDGDLLPLDVLPHVEFGPVREGKDPDGLALADAGVVQVPQLRPLVLGIPAVALGAEGEDALLGAGLLLVAASAAEHYIETVQVQGLFEGLGLHDICEVGRSVGDGAYPSG